MESIERLRHSIPGPMEHFGLLSAHMALCRPTTAVVLEHTLSGPFVAGRLWNVFAGVSMDRKSFRIERCGCGLRIEWIHLQLPDVDQQHGRARLDAADDSVC